MGSLFSPEEALKIGLVDRVLLDTEDANAVAESELKQFLHIPGTTTKNSLLRLLKKLFCKLGMARYLSKMKIREAALKELMENRQTDLNSFVSFATSESVQKGLGLYLQSLAKKN